MFQQTPQKRVLFPRGLTPVIAAVFVVSLLLSTLLVLINKAEPVVAATNGTLNFQTHLGCQGLPSDSRFGPGHDCHCQQWRH